MAIWKLYFHGFILLVLTVKCESSSSITVQSVSVTNDNDTVTLTVTYTALSRPDNISWVFPDFKQGGGMENIDFDQEDTYDGSSGRTVARVTHEEALSQNSKVFMRVLFLRNRDCEVRLQFPTFSTLISRPNITQRLSVGLDFQRDGVSFHPGEEVVFGGSEWGMRIDAVLTSPELSKFEVDDPSLTYVHFQYKDGIPTRIRKYSHTYWENTRGVSIEGASWRDRGDSEKRFPIHVTRSTYTTGVITLKGVDLKWTGGDQTVIEEVSFKQNLYVLKEAGEEAMRPNSVFMKTSHSHYFNDYDMPINTHTPTISFAVYGNPTPYVTLYRACANVVPAEAEITEVREESKFEVIRFFTFRNATQDVQGSYIVKIRSGDMEMREILSVGFA